ncbi:HalOD1 output domain-containing protein [Natronococcus occultus]|uniref:Halobacterial output domain-containing protein n=1 Tax=Natronococcus occultus SP4 TaxID=694430 RepID=L0JU20_9EURY|nr:HalOD1 output domain-containing protein [Natronococcus occultus]AGB36507.1 hypothetical protein Natoc_0647 [Natronococcus occultus SP4]
MSVSPPSDRLTPIDDAAGRTVYYDADRDTYHVWWTDDGPQSASTALVLAVGAVLETDPAELEALSRRVDPDALDALFSHWARHGLESGRVSFQFARCSVTGYASGEFRIELPDSD